MKRGKLKSEAKAKLQLKGKQSKIVLPKYPARRTFIRWYSHIRLDITLLRR